MMELDLGDIYHTFRQSPILHLFLPYTRYATQCFTSDIATSIDKENTPKQ